MLGVPLGTALGQWLGWRVAIAALAVVGVLCVAALLVVLPAAPGPAPGPGDEAGGPARASVAIIRSARWRRSALITAVVVIGHFAAYTYMPRWYAATAASKGAGLSALLLGLRRGGLTGNWIVGRYVDRRPGMLLLVLIAALVTALVLLVPVLGCGADRAGCSGLGRRLHGAAGGACSQRSCVWPRTPGTRPRRSTWSSFQIGIGGGALLGERLFSAGRLPSLPVLGAALALAAGLMVLAARRTFPSHYEEEAPIPV